MDGHCSWMAIAVGGTLAVGVTPGLGGGPIPSTTTTLPTPCPRQTMESQVEEWYKEVGELQAQAAALPAQAAGRDAVGERQSAVGTRIVRLIEPLKERRRILLASKEVHQVSHELEDEVVSTGGRGVGMGWRWDGDEWRWDGVEMEMGMEMKMMEMEMEMMKMEMGMVMEMEMELRMGQGWRWT